MTYGYIDVISASVVMAVRMREQVLERVVERERGLKKLWRRVAIASRVHNSEIKINSESAFGTR